MGCYFYNGYKKYIHLLEKYLFKDFIFINFIKKNLTDIKPSDYYSLILNILKKY